VLGVCSDAERLSAKIHNLANDVYARPVEPSRTVVAPGKRGPNRWTRVARPVHDGVLAAGPLGVMTARRLRLTGAAAMPAGPHGADGRRPAQADQRGQPHRLLTPQGLDAAKLGPTNRPPRQAHTAAVTADRLPLCDQQAHCHADERVHLRCRQVHASRAAPEQRVSVSLYPCSPKE
jgi:hypothetical protein